MRVQTPQNKQFTAKLLQEHRSMPKPPWMKIRPPTTDKFTEIKRLLKEKKLNTVCAEAACPNISECWSGNAGANGRGATATFMIMGETCTRACRFCYVKSGNPKGKLDPDEPRHLVEAVKIMGLEYVVLTCVTRDDLPDGGAQHWVDCITALKETHPRLIIELLTSDFDGNLEAMHKVIAAGPHVFGHNLETVERLQSAVRDPRANYQKSLKILEHAKKIANGLNKAKKWPKSLPGQTFYTKTSLMLGLGETEPEVIQTMKDARAIGVDIITFGQYLRPSPFHLPIHEYVKPDQFHRYKQLAKELKFLYCAAGPFVRSSYKAGELFLKNVIRNDKAKEKLL